MVADITNWLEGLGLGQYKQAFAEHDIDFRALPELTDDDLKDLGFSLGHRRILQAALKEQRDGQQATDLATSIPGDAPTTTRVGAERRQLTVMFCDLVGSTALSGRLDPEHYREVITSFQETCSRTVQSHGGYVAAAYAHSSGRTNML